jgi:hypothetical protein
MVWDKMKKNDKFKGERRGLLYTLLECIHVFRHSYFSPFKKRAFALQKRDWRGTKNTQRGAL